MNLNITFRHVEPSDTTKEYAAEKMGRLTRYFDGIVEGHVVLSQEKIRHLAEVTLQANGVRLNAKDETVDFHTAIDNVVDKLERQLKRYKEKLKRHKPLRNLDFCSLDVPGTAALPHPCFIPSYPWPLSSFPSSSPSSPVPPVPIRARPDRSSLAGFRY